MCMCGREEGLQREVRDLEQRCQAAEARHQDLAANIPEATRPLLRQLEAMQVTPTPPQPHSPVPLLQITGHVQDVSWGLAEGKAPTTHVPDAPELMQWSWCLGIIVMLCDLSMVRMLDCQCLLLVGQYLVHP